MLNLQKINVDKRQASTINHAQHMARPVAYWLAWCYLCSSVVRKYIAKVKHQNLSWEPQ